MKIDISTIQGIKGKSVEVELEKPLDQAVIEGTTLEPVGPVHVYAKATYTGQGAVFIEGEARAKIEAECHRCLKRFTLDITGEFKDQYYRESNGSFLKLNQNEEDALTYSGDTIDISKEVNSQLVLSLPMQLLCSAACKGLCQVCGQDLNDGECTCNNITGDIRLQPLAELYRARQKKDGSK